MQLLKPGVRDSELFHLVQSDVSESKPSFLNDPSEERVRTLPGGQSFILIKVALQKLELSGSTTTSLAVVGFRRLVVVDVMFGMNVDVDVGVFLEQHEGAAGVSSQHGVSHWGVPGQVDSVDVGSFLKVQ